MFEEEKKQYDEDCKTHERPWELWEYSGTMFDWERLGTHPAWVPCFNYRRKETAFMPKCYSGLNWRDAEHLIGKVIEYTNKPDAGWKVGKLKTVEDVIDTAHFGVSIGLDIYYHIYIRTCEETFKHPTINIGGVDLPMPEAVAPPPGTVYWVFGTPATAKDGSLYDMDVWPQCVSEWEKESLKNGAIHLTEERARAWADWWKKEVIDKIKGE